MAPSLEKKTERQAAATKSGSSDDILRLDFATFFDKNEAPHSELNDETSKDANENTVQQDEDSKTQETKSNGNPGLATFSSDQEENSAMKLADVVKQIDNETKVKDTTTISKEDGGYEPSSQSNGGSADGSAEERKTLKADDDKLPSFGDFVANFDNGDVNPEESNDTLTSNVDNAAPLKAKEGDVEAVSSTSSEDKQVDVEHSTSVDEAISEGESYHSAADSSRDTGSRSDDSSGSASDEEVGTTLAGSASEQSTADVASEGGEEEVVNRETTPSNTTNDSSIDFATYERVAALLVGMNREKIDWTAAQQMVSVASQHDAILSGFKALLLHPQCVKDGRLHKHESDSLRAWIKAQDLGLLDKVEEGNAWAQLLKGWFRAAEDKDYASAMKYYELSAEQGNALAQHSLGMLYETGSGVRKDCGKAKEYYEQSAGQGNANAQCSLGQLYLGGKGVSQDFERARHYFELAVEQDHAWAQSKLGNLYKEGTGVEQDYEKAKRYYEMAVSQGLPTAQCDLGNMYVKGTGVPEDYERARHLYELAVEQGCPEAQNNLGHLYKNGMGVAQDYEVAKHYYTLAARQGFAGGQSSLDSLDQSSCVIS